jgi:hypothetical protein
MESEKIHYQLIIAGLEPAIQGYAWSGIIGTATVRRGVLMRKALVFGASLLALAAATVAFAQEAKPRSTITQSLTPPALPQARVTDALIEFPLPKGEAKYGSINGHKMHTYVEELARISDRYRDAGHPKFWGRIIGAESDTETNEWLAGKFRDIGLSDVRIQPLDLPPQWMPQSWDVALTQDGRTIHLDSAQPDYDANPLPAGGVDLDAVYAGLGTEADFAGKDVKGKAVFVYSQLGAPEMGAVKRAVAHGAAVVLEVSMLPGNMRYQAYPSATDAPAFTLGHDDGVAAREMMAAGPVKVHVSFDVQKVANLKTALVWGTLPGATDETIYVVAHKDGWFEGASDNGSGVASMLGLAEYFAKVPKAQRKRTMIFVGLDGHHNGATGGVGRKWMVANKATLFPKTALFLNVEHPATIFTQPRPRYYPGDEIAWANTQMPLEWYAGGPGRPELQRIVWNAFKEFGQPVEFDPSPAPPAGDGGAYYRFLPVVSASEYHTYFHTDWETPEVVPWTGLEAATRAYAKVIDQVNKLPLGALQRPEEAQPQRSQ